MHIVMVWPTFNERTAVGIRGLTFARTWKGLGATVDCIVPKTTDHEPADLNVVRAPLWSTPRQGIRHMTTVRQLRKQMVGADVVIASSPPAMLAWQAWRAARAAKVPFVADVRDLATASLAEVFGRRPRHRLLAFMEDQLYRGSDSLQVVSQRMGDRIAADHGVAREIIHLVPNGGFPDASGRPPPDVDLIFVGYMHDEGRRPLECAETIVQVARQRPDLRVAFIGWNSKSHLEKKVEAILADAEVAVEFVASVNREAVKSWIKRSRLGLVPVAPQEVFRTAVGAKTYEYLCLGTPLAVLGHQGDSELRDLAEGQGCGVFGATPASLATAITNALDDAQAMERMAANARRVGDQHDRRELSERSFHDVLQACSRARS